MKKIVILLVALILTGALVGIFYFKDTAIAKDRTLVISSGGHSRSYLIHTPAMTDTKTPRKMIVVFHGLEDTSSHFESTTGFSQLADAHNFIVVYPNSFISSWADGRNMAPEDGKRINDVQFVRDVVADVESKYAIDTAHIFATGFSSGGYFTYKLACEGTDIFKAFAPVGAGFPDTLTESCKPAHARSLLFVEGSEEGGGGTTDSGVRIYSAEETIDAWYDINECSDAVPYVGDVAQTGIHTKCKDGTRIGETVIVGAGHSWVRNADFDTSRAIIEFFENEP